MRGRSLDEWWSAKRAVDQVGQLPVAEGRGAGEGVGKMPDLGYPAVFLQHFHDVETEFHWRLPQPPQVIERGQGKVSALVSSRRGSGG
jgi:hypothetical protein